MVIFRWPYSPPYLHNNQRETIMKSEVSLISDKSACALFEYLLRVVMIQRKFEYLAWIESSSKQYAGKEFYGLVNKDSFKIVPLIYGKNFFTPVILGVLKNQEKQKSLEITFIDSPYMKAVKIILSILLFGTLIAFVSSGDMICLFPLGSCLIVLITFLLLNRRAKNAVTLTISKSILSILQ